MVLLLVYDKKMMPNIAFVDDCLSFLLHYELTVASLGFGEKSVVTDLSSKTFQMSLMVV